MFLVLGALVCSALFGFKNSKLKKISLLQEMSDLILFNVNWFEIATSKPSTMKKLENKSAIITGAGSGMGRAMALLFAQEGCSVLATDVSKERLDELEQEAKSANLNLEVMVADMSIDSDIKGMID